MQTDHDLIRRIYDSSLDPETISPVLQEICERIGAFGAIIFDCQTINGLRRVGLQHHSQAFNSAVLQTYIARFNDDEVLDQDRFADLSSTGNDIQLIHDKILYRGNARPGKNVEAMLGYGISDRYGALLSKESWNTDRFAFQFATGAATPSPDQVGWAQDILGHLAKALSIGRVFQQQTQSQLALQSFLDRMDLGIAILGPSGQVIFANTELRRIAQERSEITFASNGTVVISAGSETGRLDRLLTDNSAHGTCGARPRREAVMLDQEAEDSASPQALFIEVCPIARHPELDHFGDKVRLVSVLDPNRPHIIKPDLVAHYFPLSKAELSILGMIANGQSNSEIAEQRCRSVETVNSQIKSILRKTETRNRAELIKVALSLSTVTLSAL